MLAERLTQIKTDGGSADTEVTAVAVIPDFPVGVAVVMIVTVDASRRIARLNSSFSATAGLVVEPSMGLISGRTLSIASSKETRLLILDSRTRY